MTNTTRSLAVGLLAALAAACGHASQQIAPSSRNEAADSAPHRSASVQSSEVRLHYLEWAGDGPAVVLLPGYLLTAHAFDDIGTLLSKNYRVIAVTPRGFGESTAPDSAEYTIRMMADDLRALLDSLTISRAALVGHSMSGSTITDFATRYPERVTKLIFLDAFPYYLAAGGDSVDALSPVSTPPFRGPTTYPRIREFLSRYRYSGWSSALEADMRVQPLGDEMTRRNALTEGFLRDQRTHPPDLSQIVAPALQICAVPSVATQYPWLRRGTDSYDKSETYVRQILRPFARSLCTRFASLVPHERTMEVAGSHYVFFTQPAMTATAIHRFLIE